MVDPTTIPELPKLERNHRMPDVVLIGAAKSATTSLASRLDEHPRIQLGRVKEPSFFSLDELFHKGLDWYSNNFFEVTPDQLALDASTSYTRWPQHPYSAERIRHYAPNAKLIYIMRHPVDRAYSHYVHRWSKERFPGQPFRMSFEEYVKDDPMVLDSSDYRGQIERYLEHFPLESLLLLFTSDYHADATATLGKICRFLGISDDLNNFRTNPTRANQASDFLESRVRISLTSKIKSIPGVGGAAFLLPRTAREFAYGLVRQSPIGRRTKRSFTAPAMQQKTRDELIERFSESNAWVSELTGADLSDWNS